MINWEDLITKNKRAVVNFAKGSIRAVDFQKAFSGSRTNYARCAVRKYGALYARRLSRKALKRRGFVVSPPVH